MKKVDDMNPGFDILYLGHKYGTSRHRAEALRRLGNRVTILDPWKLFIKNKILNKVMGKLVFEAGAGWLEPYVRRRILNKLKNRHVDVVWSDQCVFLGRATASELRCQTNYMVTYAIDDPFGTRDRNKFTLYREALGLFDLVVVVREPNVTEAYEHGARNVLRVFRSADEIAHRPLVLTPEKGIRWASDVTFIGTWMPERGPFLKRLMELGVPLTIYGNRWQKAWEWPVLKKVWRGPGLVGESYVKAIQGAKVCIGLISKGNRDLHTQRSAEIPYIGSVLCAKRTDEHMAMYRENKEAVFWNTPEECAKKCFALLSDEPKRKAIARAGRECCLLNGYLNEPIMERILNNLLTIEEEKRPLHSISGRTPQ
jgi:spore maturation protein CgeB